MMVQISSCFFNHKDAKTQRSTKRFVPLRVRSTLVIQGLALRWLFFSNHRGARNKLSYPLRLSDFADKKQPLKPHATRSLLCCPLP